MFVGRTKVELTEGNFSFTIKDRSMQRLFQFAALALALLMLAPAAVAVTICNAQTENKECVRPCCDRMQGMEMAMPDSLPPVGDQARIQPLRCCVVTPATLAQTAALVSGTRVEKVAVVAQTVVIADLVQPDMRARSRQYPPGDALRTPSASCLCTFLI